ncbi:MurR/RpiR family transcriptional regulator [Enterococcus sp. LJL120]
MEDIHTILISFIDNETNTTDSHIAKTIFNQLNQLENTSIEELSSLCNVSKSAISRFCKKIGFEGMFELRYLINKFIHRRRDKFSIEGYDAKLISHQDYIDLQLKELASFKQHYQEAQVHQLAQYLCQYQKIVMMGNLQSTTPAILLQATLLQLDIVTQVITSPQKQKEFFETPQENCLILIFSLSGILLTRYNYKQFLQKPAGTKLVLLTNNETPLHKELYDLIIQLRTKNDYSTDHVPFILLTNLIALACYQRK